jgi:hypothetical protein
MRSPGTTLPGFSSSAFSAAVKLPALVWLGLAAPQSAPAEAVAPAPAAFNVLVFTTDDMDFSSVNANGNPVPGLTPNIDRLAASGMVFERAHVPNAVLAWLVATEAKLPTEPNPIFSPRKPIAGAY